MSLKPGLAKDWFIKFHTDVYPRDEVVLRGKKMKPPRYYDKMYELVTGEDLEMEVKVKRQVDAELRISKEREATVAYMLQHFPDFDFDENHVDLYMRYRLSVKGLVKKPKSNN